MDWSHIQFASIAPYIGGVLIVGGALVGSILPPALRVRLELYVLLPGLLLAAVLLAADCLIRLHSWPRAAAFAALGMAAGLWLLWRLRARRRGREAPEEGR